MQQFIDYAMAQRTTAGELTDQVQRLIDKGWQPYAAPFSAGDSFVQAMVLTEESRDSKKGEL